MIRQIITLPMRNDSAGEGHFNAPRGTRKHRGTDWESFIGRPVLSPVSGIVLPHGQAYNGTDRYRIVNIQKSDGFVHRLFYVDPTVEPGTEVTVNTPVGIAQNVTQHYPDDPEQWMLPHVHYEVRDLQGRYRNPENLDEFF